MIGESVVRQRITPACAGNSSRFSFSHPYSKDHPRVCGEQHVPYDAWARDGGSPPRVRGTAAITFAKATQDGITPACAGNSLATAPRCWAKPDHPRVCGEQRRQLSTMSSAMGSPPRVRGTGRDGGIGSGVVGITPACAGNSCVSPPCAACRGDHPRVCGDQSAAGRGCPGRGGSPPRVRGTVGGVDHVGAAAGITPACAGNSKPRGGGVISG